MDVGHGGVVVEALGLLVREMAESVPLGRGLGVEGPFVVVDETGTFLVDFFVEGLALEERAAALEVERGVEGYSGRAEGLAMGSRE